MTTGATTTGSAGAGVPATIPGVPMPSVQDLYIPDGTCFGCGPTNVGGLRLRSYPDTGGRGVRATWQPSPAYQAVPDVLCGGIIGTLLDCHTGAAVAFAVHARDGRWPFREGPRWATAEYAIRLRRPVPTSGDVELVAEVTELDGHRAVVDASLQVDGEVHATCLATWKEIRPRGGAAQQPTGR